MPEWHESLFTGLFRQLGRVPPRGHDPALPVWAAQAAPWRGDLGPVDSGGVGWDDATARGAAFGEGVERLQAYPLPQDELIETSFADWPLDEAAIGPGRWVLFHREQYEQPGFPHQPLETTTRCRWTCCRQALTGEPMWAPADLVYLHPPVGVPHVLCPGLSTGLASGRVGDPVVLRGLQEVIERDAVVGMWWGRYPLLEISVDMVWAMLGEQAEEVRRPNLSWRFLRIDTPFSDHVTLAVVQGEDLDGPLFSIGSACRETREASLRKALMEAVHGRHYVRWLQRERMPTTKVPCSFAEHAAYYTRNPDALRRTPLAAKVPTDQAPTFCIETLPELVDRLGPTRPVLLRNMTPPALATAGLGWQVVRVVVPGLQPLHGHHQLAHLGGPHWQPRGLRDYAAVPPHPFP